MKILHTQIRLSVADRIAGPIDVHILIPEICDYVMLDGNAVCDYIYFANVIKVVDLKIEKLTWVIQVGPI